MPTRFAVRFANGYWTLFDREEYQPLDTFALERHALEACYWATETGSWRVSNWAVRWEARR